jgi:hypothetical protein
MAVRSEGKHAAARAKLAQLINDSRLPVVVFSQWVLGSDRTAQRYLAGGAIPQTVATWLMRVESVEHNGAEVIIRMQWHPRNHRWNRLEIIRRRARFFADAKKATQTGEIGQ